MSLTKKIQIFSPILFMSSKTNTLKVCEIVSEFYPLHDLLKIIWMQIYAKEEKRCSSKDGFDFTKGIVPAFLFTAKGGFDFTRGIVPHHPFSPQRCLLFQTSWKPEPALAFYFRTKMMLHKLTIIIIFSWKKQ